MIRPYESKRDAKACRRIWQEVGWISEEPTEALDWLWTHGGSAFVAELNGEAECLVTSAPGDLRYQSETLPFACITSVATSRVGRRQGLALHTTAFALAQAADAGALVVGLGMFEQGFYNRLGFGTGTYEHYATLPLQELNIDGTPRPPLRLSQEDWEAIHMARLRRRRTHGSVSLFAAAHTRSRMYSGGNKAFGLGYADHPDGSLSHLIWAVPYNVHSGPYDIRYCIYQTREQFLELLALLKALGDQIHTIRISEPTDIQLQDFIRQPFRLQALTAGSSHHINIRASAPWQMRMCDVPACLAHTHFPGAPVRFNLQLDDPVERYVPADSSWRGVAGEYIVTLGPQSEAKWGQETGLPTMRASVNAFTRLWLGVRPASGLAITDEIVAPLELLESLDNLIRLPQPHPDWDM